ncbi:MAG: DUF4139 domain-containing protein [Alphaproteobacteria bacterium]|nr:DUF4139 domain-containing protein [Alphaproteobacteria bacterium]
MNSYHRALVLCAVLLLAAGSASAAEREIGLDSQEAVSLTVYNTNLALVRDQRKVALDKGRTLLALTDVSAQIRPETVDFAVLDDAAQARVIEQYFAYDLLSPQALLEKSLGRRIGVIRINPATGEEVHEDGIVLSTNGGIVLRVGDRVETINSAAGANAPYRFVFDTVPEDLRARPTLVLTVDSAAASTPSAVLRYLTGGLSWTADYVAQLAADEKSLSLKGWVTVTNTSGSDYREARLQLVAGDVNVVSQKMTQPAVAMMESAAMRAPAADQGMAPQGLADYHLYTVARPTDLLDRQTKQIALLTAASVPVTKEYVATGNDYVYRSRIGTVEDQRVQVWLEFENNEADGLGLPLPRGVVRVYTTDGGGDEQFIGEDAVDHTPKGEEVRLNVGRAFDVTVDRRQTDYRDNRSQRETYWEFDTAYEIVVKNAKDVPVSVKLEEPIPGDWRVLRESQPHDKKDAQTAVWTIDVPAEGETTLTYTVRVILPR